MGRRKILVIASASFLLSAVMVAWALHRNGRTSGYLTEPVDRGEIAEVVGATGLLQAVTTVQVGSQVSGTIQTLGADFNSVVHVGQVIARLEPALFEAHVAQMRANLLSAKASVERAKASLDDAKQKYDRSRELAAQNLVTESDLESAKAVHDGAVAQLRDSEASVAQAEAALNQAELDLVHSIITAPIDGVVLARNVDVGQTVAASFQAPTLFVIANDLTKMQVNASIDEADIGRVRQGQDVTFRVDAYPDEAFSGKVAQIRLQPITNQNVVTYNTIIDVANKDLRLMPGMTATVSVIIQRRPSALRLPAVALRFRPEGLEESRQRAEARGGAAGDTGAAKDAKTGRSGTVFLLGEDGRPKPTRVRLGISDGRYLEVLAGLDEGTRVIAGLGSPGTPQAAASPLSNPFAPQRFQPRSR